MTSYRVQRGHRDRGPRGGRGAGQGRPPAALPLHRREGEIFLAQMQYFYRYPLNLTFGGTAGGYGSPAPGHAADTADLGGWLR